MGEKDELQRIGEKDLESSDSLRQVRQCWEVGGGGGVLVVVLVAAGTSVGRSWAEITAKQTSKQQLP